MQSYYPEVFERDMAGTLQEWHMRLPRAIGDVAWTAAGGDAVTATLTQGQVSIQWSPLPDRVIALMRMPRLRVVFHFAGAPDGVRLAFMQHFDLVMQRGGG